MTGTFLQIRRRSLARGNVLVGLSVVLACLISDFPHNRASLWLILPAVGVVLGTVETARCIQRRWSYYHATVVMSLYMDLMAAALVFFALLYPYIPTLSSKL